MRLLAVLCACVGLSTAHVYFHTNRPDAIDRDALASFYHDLRNNTKHLSADGEGLVLKGIYFMETHDEARQMMGPAIARTFDRLHGKQQVMLDPDNATEFAERASPPHEDYPFSCTEPECFPANSYGRRGLFSLSEEKFLYGRGCSFIAGAQPYVWATVAYLVTGAVCGGSKYVKGTCGITFAVGGAAAGNYVGPGIQQNCEIAFAALTSHCGDMSAGAVCTSQRSFDVYVDANTYVDPPKCPKNTQDTSGNTDCTTYVCNGQCNPP